MPLKKLVQNMLRQRRGHVCRGLMQQWTGFLVIQALSLSSEVLSELT
jgi:hypothetical protein